MQGQVETRQTFDLRGTLGGDGTLRITRRMTWTAGQMTGSGRTEIANGATLDITHDDTISLSERTLENSGTINWTRSHPILHVLAIAQWDIAQYWDFQSQSSSQSRMFVVRHLASRNEPLYQ